MTDTLRDRIAKAIYLEANNWGGPNWETISPKVKPAYMAQADAVIRELGIIDDPLSAHRLRMCADTMDAYWASVGEEYDSDTLREEADAIESYIEWNGDTRPLGKADA